ncbi:MAG TPA: GGDEF domain-containing protein [Hyphomonas sp.]|nr:GGDEF domain-containing protein [Hyphomonas sp.]
MSAYARDIKDSLTFFVFVATTALCLSFTFSVFMYQFGVLEDPQRFLIANLVVAACVAIPTATIASQHEFQLKRYQRQLESLASTDPLTGLLNRRFFRISAEDEIQRQRRAGGMAAIVVFDIDSFKSVNDRFGHHTGDAVLKRIAEIAYSELRGPFDKLGRWGGEEFVILLSSVSREQAWIVCERLRERLEAAVIEHGGAKLSITASFGYEMLTSDSTLDRVLESADRALYVSKQSGRNRITYAGPRLAA